MWISKNPFDNFGYMNADAFIKGNFEDLLPHQCYQIKIKRPGNYDDSFQIVPVDSDGHETGPAALTTSGQMMYSFWEKGSRSSEYNISDSYII